MSEEMVLGDKIITSMSDCDFKNLFYINTITVFDYYKLLETI